MDIQPQQPDQSRCPLCKSIFVWLAIAGLLGYLFWMFFNRQPIPPSVSVSSPGASPMQSATNFEECIAQGNPVMESYPRQCRTPDGKLFVENIGNVLEKIDVIRITRPRPGDIIKSPAVITGQARGSWFFEASFPVRLFDANGKELAVKPAEAQSEWMTEDFVPFRVILEFETSATDTGTLVLEKDNPSGLPEYADELRVPVRFR